MRAGAPAEKPAREVVGWIVRSGAHREHGDYLCDGNADWSPERNDAISYRPGHYTRDSVDIIANRYGGRVVRITRPVRP